MKLDKFSGAGSTPERRKFWDKALEAVLASRKLQGHNTIVTEHEGANTVIDAVRTRSGEVCGCNCIDTVEINADGIGYRIGEMLRPVFGTLCDPADDFGFGLLVTGVDGSGAITDFVIISGIGYSSPPSNPVGFTGSALGTGFTANCTFAGDTSTKAKPQSLEITFSDVIFDCGCIDNNNGTSRIVTDGGGFNDGTPLPIEKTASCCGSAVWRRLISPCNTSSVPYFHVQYHGGSSDCSDGSPDEIDSAVCSPVFFLRNGVYRLIVMDLTGITEPRPSIVFDGTTTDLDTPIANTAACASDGVSHGGTATVTIA